jgi:hypothetical protein
MELPAEILCEKCGANAKVLTREVDDQAIAGRLTPDDRRRVEGFFFSIECPRCGVRSQSLAPPP